jgi:hypothetical protein
MLEIVVALIGFLCFIAGVLYLALRVLRRIANSLDYNLENDDVE